MKTPCCRPGHQRIDVVSHPYRSDLASPHLKQALSPTDVEDMVAVNAAVIGGYHDDQVHVRSVARVEHVIKPTVGGMVDCRRRRVREKSKGFEVGLHCPKIRIQIEDAIWVDLVLPSLDVDHMVAKGSLVLGLGE